MPSFAGFDCGSYPGDGAMKAWMGNSPYQFVGFYLDAPCHSAHTFKTWQGKYQFLNHLGWGLIVVYVGRQQKGCGAASLSRDQGLADGADTLAKLRQEGFPAGAIIYLDVEYFDLPMSPAMSDYYRAWLGAILDDGTFQPGTYCAAQDANEVLAVAQQEYAARGLAGAPSFWIVKSSQAFDTGTSNPTGCGVAFADVWQGRVNVHGESHNGVALMIDQNVATTADPSRTSQPADAGTTTISSAEPPAASQPAAAGTTTISSAEPPVASQPAAADPATASGDSASSSEAAAASDTIT